MKALVTGASGLIGSHLARSLKKQGHAVKALVRKTSNLAALDGWDIKIAYGDMLDEESLVKAAQGCDVIFHVAAIFRYSQYAKEILFTTAEKGTVNIINAAKANGISKVIMTSSSVVLGSTTIPTTLDETAIISEESPSDYAGSKIAQEKAGFKRAKELGIKLIAACPAICVGPDDYGLTESNAIIVNYLNDPFRATWPGGCNIVSVYDVAYAHILLAEKGVPGERYVVGSENLEWRQIHGRISELCGIKGPLITATHAASYLAAAYYEFLARLGGRRPMVSRSQAKMVGRYYWYRSDKLRALGYRPRSAQTALVDAVSWIVSSSHISNSIRAGLRLSDEVYKSRAGDLQ